MQINKYFVSYKFLKLSFNFLCCQFENPTQTYICFTVAHGKLKLGLTLLLMAKIGPKLQLEILPSVIWLNMTNMYTESVASQNG